jgi:uncharacterized protein (DUF4415 family)
MAALAARTEEQFLAGIAADPDAYLSTKEDLDAAVLVLPERKLPISLRVEPDVLAFYKSGGPGYQRRMNKALRAVMESELRRTAASGARRRA